MQFSTIGVIGAGNIGTGVATDLVLNRRSRIAFLSRIPSINR